ncbi:hypothetical protein RJT34_15996 [Clitoria ternatea]|uniref:Uncharacterized protein n=1 Tax=Clitoria ternatea TaxID=43366 RepID=A0AAN9PBX4_CLITE
MFWDLRLSNFDSMWKEMVAEFGLEGDEWVNELYEKRHVHGKHIEGSGEVEVGNVDVQQNIGDPVQVRLKGYGSELRARKNGEYFGDEDDLQCQINADSSNIDSGSDSYIGNSLNDVCGSCSRGENSLNVDCGNGSRNFCKF